MSERVLADCWPTGETDEFVSRSCSSLFLLFALMFYKRGVYKRLLAGQQGAIAATSAAVERKWQQPTHNVNTHGHDKRESVIQKRVRAKMTPPPSRNELAKQLYESDKTREKSGFLKHVYRVGKLWTPGRERERACVDQMAIRFGVFVFELELVWALTIGDFPSLV